MKKIIILLLAAFSLSVKAQTVDTVFKTITACKIQPFKAKFTDTVNATRVGVKIIADDLKSYSQLFWCLLDGNGNVLLSGNAIISGTDYQNWNGNNLYPFTFIANKYNLIFQ